MENQLLDSNLSQGSSLFLNSSAQDFLRQTAKWAKFLAVMSIIFAVLIIVIGLGFGSIMKYLMAFSSMGVNESAMTNSSVSTLVAVIYGLMGLIMLYPGIRLLQFAKQSKNALDANDVDGIATGLKRLRSVFRFYGILTIIMLGFYALAIIGMMAGMSAFR